MKDLKEQLSLNQSSQLSSTVSFSRPKRAGANDAANASITISGQELFYSKIKQTYESMIRKAQSEQLSHIYEMLTSTDILLKPDQQVLMNKAAS